MQYIKDNLTKLPVEAQKKILLKYVDLLDAYNCRIEKKNIGNYIDLSLLPTDVIQNIAMDVELAVSK